MCNHTTTCCYNVLPTSPFSSSSPINPTVAKLFLGPQISDWEESENERKEQLVEIRELLNQLDQITRQIVIDKVRLSISIILWF